MIPNEKFFAVIGFLGPRGNMFSRWNLRAVPARRVSALISVLVARSTARDVNHYFQDMMYKDTKRWALTFQSYVQLTMLQVHGKRQVGFNTHTHRRAFVCELSIQGASAHSRTRTKPRLHAHAPTYEHTQLMRASRSCICVGRGEFSRAHSWI